MPLNRKYQVLATKAEATEGVFNTPAVGDATLLVFDVSHKPSPVMNERMPMRNTLSPLTAIRGLGMMDVTFSFELKGEDTTVDSVPAWGRVMVACGFKQTVNAATNVIWTPNDDPDSTPLSISLYIDGTLTSLRGCRGTSWSLNWSPGKQPMVTVTLRGAQVGNGLTDVAILAPTYPTVLPFPVHAGVGTIGGLALSASEITIAHELQSTERFEFGLEHGLKSTWNSRSKFTGSMNPEREKLATKDYLTELFAQTTNALVLNVGTGTPGRHINISAPKVQWMDLGDENREALWLAPLQFQCVGAEGGIADEISITKD